VIVGEEVNDSCAYLDRNGFDDTKFGAAESIITNKVTPLLPCLRLLIACKVVACCVVQALLPHLAERTPAPPALSLPLRSFGERALCISSKSPLRETP
jgi:hypothetical protein